MDSNVFGLLSIKNVISIHLKIFELLSFWKKLKHFQILYKIFIMSNENKLYETQLNDLNT